MIPNVRLLLAALWAGSLWGVSYLAAPSAFATLDSTLAGRVVGTMLTREAWLSIALAVLLVVLTLRSTDLDARRRRWLFCCIGGMPAGVRASPQWGTFATLHGVSQVCYLVGSILGAVLVVKSR